MSAPIAHMLISQKTRAALREKAEAEHAKYPQLAKFLDRVTDAYPKVMELGSLGPDLAFFERLSTTIIESVFGRRSRPKSMEPWGYQMHSKDPNVLPLKMFEIIWKESNPNNEYWEDEDRIKLAFVCGFLTHMAADQIIHPVVNQIAGPYYKSGDNRQTHQQCEVSQDLYLFAAPKGGNLPWADFKAVCLADWCGFCVPTPGLIAVICSSLCARCRVKCERLGRMFGKDVDLFSSLMPTTFRYMLQKAYVEAYGVGPDEAAMVKWAAGMNLSLRMSSRMGPYPKAHRALFKPSGEPNRDGEAFQKYVELKDIKDPRGPYDTYVERAVTLAVAYITALYRLYESVELDDDDRRCFSKVVRDADLSAPLDFDLFTDATQALADWEADPEAQVRLARAVLLNNDEPQRPQDGERPAIA